MHILDIFYKNINYLGTWIQALGFNERIYSGLA